MHAPHIDLRLPANIPLEVKGGIPASRAPEELIADMLEIDLPDGTTLDVGWLPEHDPTGSYRLVVYEEYWGNRVMPSARFTDVDELVAAIGRIVVARSQPPPAGQPNHPDPLAPDVTASSGNVFHDLGLPDPRDREIR